MMNLDEAIQHCEEVAEKQEKESKEWRENQVRKCELFSFAEMDYTHENECKKCAEEHRQLADWLKELKAYKETWNKLGMWLADTRLAIAPDEFLNDVDEELVRVAQVDMIDTVSEWMDEHEVEAKQNCTDCIIDGTDACSRGAGRAVDDEICGDFIPSRSEIPNTCGDAVSRAIVQEEITKSIELKENPYQLWYRIRALPSVSPQQRTGRWRKVSMDKYIQHSTYYYECSECGDQHIGQVNYCPNCGAKMEVEE